MIPENVDLVQHLRKIFEGEMEEIFVDSLGNTRAETFGRKMFLSTTDTELDIWEMAPLHCIYV